MTAASRVLLIGCGQLGTRHLQAIATVPGVREIDVVDPRPEALALGRQRLAEVEGVSPVLQVRWLGALDDAAGGGDCCIVATLAEGRCATVRAVAETLGYRRFLIEKLAAQSVEELNGLLGFAQTRQLGVWVNCKTRAYPFHARAKARLRPDEPIMLHVTGGNQGLANNGIHAADLFAFYDEATAITLEAAWIEPTLHASKRGPGLYDLSGTLIGTTARGSRFVVSFAGDHDGSDQIALTTRSFRFIVDQMQRWAVESDAADDGAWRATPFEGDLLVSRMSAGFVADIIRQGQCRLPTLGQAAVAHRFILGALQPQFSRLMEREVDRCPVV